ncbi:MAG: hypothetical protein ABI597_03840 [Gammaproteobacteria bacterium]
MPLSQKVIIELNHYLDNYIHGKTQGSDIAVKNADINEFRQRINNLGIKRSTTDKDWLDLVVEMGKKADEIQLKGTFASSCTEVMYMVLHRIRREISTQNLIARIKDEQAKLARLRQQYVLAKKQNEKETSLNEIQAQIYLRIKQLAHLGHLDPLLELDSEEIEKSLYPGSAKFSGILATAVKYITSAENFRFEYSEATKNYNCEGINTYLPLVLQSVFEQIYLEKYKDKFVKIAGTDMKAESLSETVSLPDSLSTQTPISAVTDEVKLTSFRKTSLDIPRSSELEQLTTVSNLSKTLIFNLNGYFDNYIRWKKTGSDIAKKTAECNSLRKLLNDAAQKEGTTDADWLNLICKLGSAADTAQREGTYCSDFTEAVYMVIHSLRNEIQSRNPNALKIMIASERIKLAEFRDNYVSVKKNNGKLANIQQIKNDITLTIQKLAHLGDLDPLLELSLKETSAIYFGTTKKSIPGSSVLKFAIPEQYLDHTLGFEYPEATRAYACENLNTYLPLVLQDHFPAIYMEKNKAQFKTAEEEKQAEEKALAGINDFSRSLTQLESDKVVLAVKKSAKELVSQAITEKEIKTLEEQMNTLDLKISTLNEFISAASPNSKYDLNARLQVELDKISLFKGIASQVRLVLNSDEGTKAQLEARDKLREQQVQRETEEREKLQRQNDEQARRESAELERLRLEKEVQLLKVKESEQAKQVTRPESPSRQPASSQNQIMKELAARPASPTLTNMIVENYTPAATVTAEQKLADQGKEKRLQLFNEVLTAREVKNANIPNALKILEKQFRKDRNIISKLIAEVEKVRQTAREEYASLMPS